MSNKNSPEKYPKSSAIIRFQDCDPFGHLNNARYLDYFINAREDHLKHYYDFDIYKIVRERGFAWVVSQNQISYLKPVLLMEEVVIKSSVIFYNENSILVELSMWDKEEKILKSVLWTRFVSISVATTKRINMPDFIKDLLQEIITGHVNVANGFDARVSELLEQAKTQASA